jgi:ribonuclease P protein component
MQINRGQFSNCLFRRKDRISKSCEIQEIIKNGTKSKCHFYTFYSKKKVNKRVGIIIRKFQKGTVDRNKIKRRIREIYRTNKQLFNNDTIIKVNTDLIGYTYNEIKTEILKNIPNQLRGNEA